MEKITVYINNRIPNSETLLEVSPTSHSLSRCLTLLSSRFGLFSFFAPCKEVERVVLETGRLPICDFRRLRVSR